MDEPTTVAHPPEEFDYDDDELIDCSWCGGEGFRECDDPIGGCGYGCSGDLCPCRCCNGRGHSQTVW